MKNVRKWRVLLLALSALFLLTTFAAASTDIVEPTEQLYVADYANVLSEETETKIVRETEALKALCGGEIAVVTIDFLNDLDAEEYAYEILNQWGVGDKDKNNGMVMLLVPGEGKGWITVGTGLEDYVSASTLERIMNTYLWDDFDAGNYDTAVQNTFAQLLALYESYYGIDVEGAAENAYYGSGSYEEEYSYEPAPRRSVFSTLAKIVVILIVVLLLFGGRRGGGIFFIPWFGGWFHGPRHHHDDWRHGPRGPGGFGGGHGGFGGGHGGFGGGHSGGFGGGGGRGGGAGRR